MLSDLNSFNGKTAFAAKQTQNSITIVWGNVRTVNPEEQTMQVELADGTVLDKRIPINNMIATYGAGIRFMPVAGKTTVLLYKSGSLYYHIGYYYNEISDDDREEGLKFITDDRNMDKESRILVQRYLKEGEVDISGPSFNEILLSIDGSVLVKDSIDQFIKLDASNGIFEGNFGNLSFEMEGTRIRSGNVMRPIKSDTYENDFVVIKNNLITKESELEKDDEPVYIKEFFVSVGNTLDSETGRDTTTSPTVGRIILADNVINEAGEEEATGGKTIKFQIKLSTGSAINIDEDGSIFLVDGVTGNSVKFKSGDDGEKSMRVGQTHFAVNKIDGAEIHHESGSGLQFTSDGNVSLQNKTGRGLNIDQNGLTIDQPGASISLFGKYVNIMASKTLSIGASATEFLLPALAFSSYMDSAFDSHIHAGPSGVPTVPLLSHAAVLSGQLQVAGIQVSK
jgi:hypothetical protein